MCSTQTTSDLVQLQDILFSLTTQITAKLLLAAAPPASTPALRSISPTTTSLAKALLHPEILRTIFQTRTLAGQCAWFQCTNPTTTTTTSTSTTSTTTKPSQHTVPEPVNAADAAVVNIDGNVVVQANGPLPPTTTTTTTTTLSSKQIDYIKTQTKQSFKPKSVVSPTIPSSANNNHHPSSPRPHLPISPFPQHFNHIHCSNTCRDESYRFYQAVAQTNGHSLPCFRQEVLDLLQTIAPELFVGETEALNGEEAHGTGVLFTPDLDLILSKLTLNIPSSTTTTATTTTTTALTAHSIEKLPPFPRPIRLAALVNEYPLEPALMERAVFLPGFGAYDAFCHYFHVQLTPFLTNLHDAILDSMATNHDLVGGDNNFINIDNVVHSCYRTPPLATTPPTRPIHLTRPIQLTRQSQRPLSLSTTTPPLPHTATATTSFSFTPNQFQPMTMLPILDLLDLPTTDLTVLDQYKSQFDQFTTQHFTPTILTLDALTEKFNTFHQTRRPYRNRLWRSSDAQAKKAALAKQQRTPKFFTTKPLKPHSRPPRLWSVPLIRLYLKDYQYSGEQCIRLLRGMWWFFNHPPRKTTTTTASSSSSTIITSIPTLLTHFKPPVSKIVSQGFPTIPPRHIFPHSQGMNAVETMNTAQSRLKQSGLAPPPGNFVPKPTKSPYLFTSRPTTSFYSESEYLHHHPITGISMTSRQKEFQIPPQFTYPALLRLIKSLQYDYLIHYDIPFGGKRTNKMKRVIREKNLNSFGAGSNWNHFPSRRVPHGEFVLQPTISSRGKSSSSSSSSTTTITSPSSSLLAYLNAHPNHLNLIFLHPRVSKYLLNFDPSGDNNNGPQTKKGVHFNLGGGFGVIKGSTRDANSESDDDENDDDTSNANNKPKVKCVTFAPYCYVGQISHHDDDDDDSNDEVISSIPSQSTTTTNDEPIHYTQIDPALVDFYLAQTNANTAGKTIFPTLLWAKLSIIAFPWDQADPTCYPELPRPTKNRLAHLIREKSKKQQPQPQQPQTPTTSTSAKTSMPIDKFQLLSPFIYQLTVGDGLQPKDQLFILQSLYNRLVLVGESWPQAWDFFDRLRQAAIATANQQRARSNQYKGKNNAQSALTTTNNTTTSSSSAGTTTTSTTTTATTTTPSAFPSHINASAAVNKTVGSTFRDDDAKRLNLREIRIGPTATGGGDSGVEIFTRNDAVDPYGQYLAQKAAEDSPAHGFQQPQPQSQTTSQQSPTTTTTRTKQPLSQHITTSTDFSALAKPIPRDGTRRRPKAIINATDLFEHPKHLVQLEGHSTIVDTQINALHTTTRDLDRSKRHRIVGDEPAVSPQVQEFIRTQEMTPYTNTKGEIYIPYVQKANKKVYREYGELSLRVKQLQLEQERRDLINGGSKSPRG